MEMIPRSTVPNRRKDLFAAVTSVALVLVVAASGGVVTAATVGAWYAGLNKPAFNPPNAAFGPAWSLLYLMMAIAAWRVWRSSTGEVRARRLALVLYAAQLGLNLAWSLIFFGLHLPALAFAEILVLLTAILAMTAAFWRIDRLSALLMLPYSAWVMFASLLNFEVWRLN